MQPHILQKDMKVNLHIDSPKIQEIIPPVQGPDQARLRLCVIINTLKPIIPNNSTED